MRRTLIVCLFAVAFMGLVAGETCQERVGNWTQKAMKEVMDKQVRREISLEDALKEVNRISEIAGKEMMKCVFGRELEISDLVMKDFLPIDAEPAVISNELDYTKCTLEANQKYNFASQQIGQKFTAKMLSNVEFGLGMNDALKVYTAEMQRCKNLK